MYTRMKPGDSFSVPTPAPDPHCISRIGCRLAFSSAPQEGGSLTRQPGAEATKFETEKTWAQGQP